MKIFKKILLMIILLICIAFVYFIYQNLVKFNVMENLRNGAVSSYYQETGDFPIHLNDLIPKYIKNKPNIEYMYLECQQQLYLEVGSILVNKINQYKNDNGYFPNALQDLVPNYISKLPVVDYGRNNFSYSTKEERFNLSFYIYHYYYDKLNTGWITVE